MTDKKNLKVLILITLALCLISIGIVSVYELIKYRQSVYSHMSLFCQFLTEDYPETEKMVLSTLKKYTGFIANNTIKNNYFLYKYGYSQSYFSSALPQRIAAALIILLLTGGFICGMVLLLLRKWNQKRINSLTSYLEQVNTGNTGVIIQTKEDDFSQLQDEIYKTVTNLYNTKEAAVHAKENYADNLANIAHQLKTPITAAVLSLQLLQEENPTIQTGTILKQFQWLTHLEEALLTLSQIDSGTLNLEKNNVDIYTALCLAAENLNDFLLQRNIKISIPEKGCIEILGDLEWTMQAFINLIKNCMEHSPSGGTIYCNYTSNPLYTQIQIWDEGDGFAKEDIPHLFERFYRGRNASGNGIGIGLSLAHSIFEMQNGSLTAGNLPSGGACFEIRIYSH